MAANEKDIEWFDDVFDLSPDKKDESNEQTEEYGHGTESSESFDDLAKEVSDDIKDSDDKGTSLPEKKVVETIKEDPHDIVKSVCSAGEVDDIVQDIKEEPKEEPKEESSDNPDDFFDELPVQKVIEKIVEKEEIEDEVNSSPVEENHSKSPAPPIEYGEVGDGDDRIEWMLESPSSMYESFYAKKRNLLFRYMVGGQMEYKRWTQELEDARVIIKGEVFDHNAIIRQMEAVQQHRERVKSIHVRVNNQYFTFKRFVEMMKGTLARIEYLKPVIRQEGLIMEHMRDLELYYARLEALHDSATKTEKTLEKAFDTLSRKCTICMELKAPERVDLQSKSTSYTPPAPAPAPPVREKSNEFDEFDDLPPNAQAVPIGHKIGAIGWGDV
jgi:hypothetical protein